MKIKAIYIDQKQNPFGRNVYQTVKRVEFPDETPMEEIEKLAREATPEHHRFVSVEKENL